jgi:hypothetical protein
MSNIVETTYHNSLTFASFQDLANREGAKLGIAISFRSDGSVHLLTVKELTKDHVLSLLELVTARLKDAEPDQVNNFKI